MRSENRNSLLCRTENQNREFIKCRPTPEIRRNYLQLNIREHIQHEFKLWQQLLSHADRQRRYPPKERMCIMKVLKNVIWMIGPQLWSVGQGVLCESICSCATRSREIPSNERVRNLNLNLEAVKPDSMINRGSEDEACWDFIKTGDNGPMITSDNLWSFLLTTSHPTTWMATRTEPPISLSMSFQCCWQWTDPEVWVNDYFDVAASLEIYRCLFLVLI